MLSHLISIPDEYELPLMRRDAVALVPLNKVKPSTALPNSALLDAQISTADWLEQVGATDTSKMVDNLQKQAGREAFLSTVTPVPQETQRAHLLQMTSPVAVRQIVGMLSAYDWAFVDCAKEIRGYTVAMILEETKNKDSRHKLRALEMLGKITEVALFTERSVVTKVDMTDAALEERIRGKLDKLRSIIDITDAIDLTDDDAPPLMDTPIE